METSNDRSPAAQPGAFTCWLAGRPCEVRRAFALEICARLRRRLLLAEFVEGHPAWPMLDSNTDPDPAHIKSLCAQLTRHGTVVLVAESALSQSRRQEISRELEPVVVVHVDVEGPQPFEPPVSPDLLFCVGSDSMVEVLDELITLLERRGLLGPATPVDDRDEELLTQRLRNLGYL